MQSTLTLQPTDPHDAFAIEPEVARADQASPDPVHEVLSLLSRRRAQMASDAPAATTIPTVDTTFRATAVDAANVPGDRPAKRAWAKKVIVTFLFALCSALAASAWKYHGEATRQLMSNWMLPSAFSSSAPTQTPAPAPVQAAAAEQAPAQPAPAAPPPAGAAPALAASPADSAQLLPSMARDLATMGQQIEQLKASIDQLRDSQAQMSRDIAKKFRDQGVRGQGFRGQGFRAATGSNASAAAGRSAAAQAEAGLPAGRRLDVAAAAISTASAAGAVTARAATRHGRAGRRTGSAAADAAALTSVDHIPSNSGGSNQLVSDRPPSTTIAAPVT
jgi:hypothetical protein